MQGLHGGVRVISKEQFSGIGADLAVLGAIVSCIGVTLNNIFLNHIFAMQIWVLSNTLLMVWAYGLWKNWWDGGISGFALTVMYAYMLVSGAYGLWFA